MPTKNLSDLPSPPPPKKVREDVNPFKKKSETLRYLGAAKNRKRHR